MSKRIFPYPELLASEVVDLDNPKLQVEIILDGVHVNLGVVGGRPSSTLILEGEKATWISLRGKTLDDLITALEYARLKLNKQEEN